MGSFLKELESFQQGKRPRRPCVVGLILEGLKADEAKELRAVMADESYSSTDIVAALGRLGQKCSASQMRTHRAGRCNCVRN